MGRYRLIIGNRNYSSWSLRPWLMLKATGIDFEDEVIQLFEPGFKERLLEQSPAGLVPILKDGDFTVWDTLAIGEYLAERHPDAKLWPEQAMARARARSVSAEMHSGFGALRSALPMNMRAKRHVTITEDVQRDINRINQIWTTCRQEFGKGGDYLFGGFSIADAMYAPVVSRFETYGVAGLSVLAETYRQTMLANPAMVAWTKLALQETWVIAEDEAGKDQ